MSVIPRIVIVTGGNSGIGYAAVRKILQSDKAKYHVFLGARNPKKATDAVEAVLKECPGISNTVEPLVVDLCSDESIEMAREIVQNKVGRLDTLINNAGASYDLLYLKGQVSLREAFSKAYDGNVAGTNVMTHAFMPLLLKSDDPRLIFVSGLSMITQAAEEYFPTPPQPAGWPKPSLDFETIGYRCSKVALNMLMLDWNYKLKADGVKVWGLMPGMLATNLGGGVNEEVAMAMNLGHPDEGGDFIKKVMEGERDADTGKLVAKGGRITPW